MMDATPFVSALIEGFGIGTAMSFGAQTTEPKAILSRPEVERLHSKKSNKAALESNKLVNRIIIALQDFFNSFFSNNNQKGNQ